MDPYLSEQLAGPKNQLQISSTCNANCIFCSNNQNPFKIRRERFRTIDEIKEALKLIQVKDREPIVIGASLPGRISEGECFLHPQIFEVLGLIREKFPNNVIDASTNSTMLTPSFVEKLSEFNPLQINISYHSDDQNNWSNIFRLPVGKHLVAKNSFPLLKSKKIPVRGSIVALPNLVGYDDIERTIEWMSKFVESIIIWPPGYTKMTNPSVIEILDTSFEDLSKFFITMRKRYNTDIRLLTDMYIPLPFNPMRVMRESFQKKHKNVGWFLSEAVFYRASNIIEACSLFIPNHHFPILTKNYTYGGNITCAGLLMVNDFKTAIKEAIKNHRIDLAILPQTLNRDNNKLDLMNDSYELLESEIDIPIWYA